MTLEKLLIFGFGLAVAGVLAVTATNMSTDRGPQYDGYKTGVTEIINKIP